MLIHPWESGRDNAVEWDAPLSRVLPEVTAVRRRDTDFVDAAERPSHEHYRRFLTLVRHGTALGWNQRELARAGRSASSTPGFSAILARACLDLAGWRSGSASRASPTRAAPPASGWRRR